MRNHFLRASGTPATGGDGGGDGGGGSCGTNDTGGTNEWAFNTASGTGLFVSTNNYTSSIDTANYISYLASHQSNKLNIRKITNTGTISWTKTFEFSGTAYSYFYPHKGHSLSTGKQIIVGEVNLSSTYGTCFFCINADGTVEWCKRITPASSSSVTGHPYHLTVDSNDNIYCIFEQQESNSDGTASSNNFFFVMKLNSSGVIQWQKKFRSSDGSGGYIESFTHPNGLAVDSNYVYITNTRNNALSMQIVTLNVSDGALNAVKHFGTGSSNREKPSSFDFREYSGSLLEKDNSGDFYMLFPCKAGNYYNKIVLAKFDSSYGVDWSKELDLATNNAFWTGNSGGFALTITPNVKNIVVSFAYRNYAVSNSNRFALVAVFDSSGSLSSQRSIGGVPSDGQQNIRHINGLSSDNQDHFYLTAGLPWSRENSGASYYHNTGEAIVKHTTCSAMPDGTYFSTLDSSNHLSTISGSPSGFAEIDDATIISVSNGSAVISSTAFSDDATYGSTYLIDTPTTGFTMTSQNTTVSDLASGSDFKSLDHI